MTKSISVVLDVDDALVVGTTLRVLALHRNDAQLDRVGAQLVAGARAELPTPSAPSSEARQ